MKFKLSLLALAVLLLPLLFSLIVNASTIVNAPAVDSDGKGLITPVVVTATLGSGRIRTDIQSSLIATETEESIRNAASAASQLGKVNLKNIDINVDITSQAQIIDGPSGGLAFAIAIYNEIRHLVNESSPAIRSDLVITGAITPEGRVERVGGVEEKVVAAFENDAHLMLIASGQSNADALDYVIYSKEISKGEMQVVEVSTLADALDYAYTKNASKVNAPEFAIKPLVLENFQATSKTTHFKQIASEEIINVQRELVKLTTKLINDKDIQTSAIVRSVNETLKNAQQSLDKGYYYTAANTAFLAKINLQTANAGETTPEKFTQMLNNLTSEINNANNLIEMDSNNYEAIAAAQLRFWWAKTRLQDVKQEFQTKKQVTLENLRDYYNAKAWFDASQKLFTYARTINPGEKVNELNVREYALDLIEQSAVIANKTSDNEVQWHFKTAKNEFANADYATTILDLQFVISAEKTNNLLTNKTLDIIINESAKIQNSNIYSTSKNAWAELYYGNALYSLQEANRTEELSSLVSAIRLRELATGFQDAENTIEKELVNPRPTKNHSINVTAALPLLPEPQISATITEVNENAGILQMVALGIIALGVIILVIVIIGNLKQVRVSKKDLIDKLDEALITGRISETTYNRLRKKYKTTTKNENKTSKSLSAKQRLKQRR
ncbi:MAG: S16 family serine protease [Candidatus Micrarchaeota archaeon]